MSKSPDAFRTIREVADWLGVAAHVLRFWESKFSQIRPVKRAGGRRYYRPSDMELVGGIKVLLHDRGMTVRGVQRMLREEGVAAVAALSPPLETVEAARELAEGIAEEAAWREDALADETGGDGATPVDEAEAGAFDDVSPARDDGGAPALPSFGRAHAPAPEAEPVAGDPRLPVEAQDEAPEPDDAQATPDIAEDRTAAEDAPADGAPEHVSEAAPADDEPEPRPETAKQAPDEQPATEGGAAHPEPAAPAEAAPAEDDATAAPPEPTMAPPAPPAPGAAITLDRLSGIAAEAARGNLPGRETAIADLAKLKARIETAVGMQGP